jgi:hypothetical protein
MTEEIIKVQAPLGSARLPPPALLYDERRTHAVTVPMAELPEHVLRALRRSPNAYFEARWSAESRAWVIGDRAPPQSW